MNGCAFAVQWNRTMPAVQTAQSPLAPPARPFRGSTALASGPLTGGVLHGSGHRRPDIQIDAAAELDLETWSRRPRARHPLRRARHSAAALHGASRAPAGAPAEVVLLGGYRRRPAPMLLVHVETITADEITVEDGLCLTTPARTAADLARRAPWLTESPAFRSRPARPRA